MPNWSGGILTTQGQALQAKVDAGQTTLNFTKMKLGSGVLANGQNLQSLTDLIAPQQNVPISGISVSGNITTLTGVITNSGLATGYQVRELGVFAQDPAAGEILYSITIDSMPDFLPPEGGATAVSQEFNYHIAVSNAANVSATISTSGLVTVGMLQDHTNNKNNPHNTTALQVGALPIVGGTMTGPIILAADPTADMHVANKKFVVAAINALINAAPGAMDTLKEIADALGDDPNFATTILNQLAQKAPAGYGIGGNAKQISNTDINTVTTGGLYWLVNGNTNTPDSTNPDYWFLLVGDEQPNNSIMQTAWSTTTGKCYYRLRAGASNWSAWKQNITSDMTDVLDANTLTTPGVFKTGGSTTNMPYSSPDGRNQGNIFQLTFASGYYEQMFFSIMGGVWTRYYNKDQGTWSGWKQVVTADMTGIFAPAGYGLGTPVALLDNVDLNNYVTTGFYNASTSVLNTPINGNWWYVMIMQHHTNVADQTINGGYCVQVAYGLTDINQQTAYIRNRRDGVWTAWKQIATTDQIGKPGDILYTTTSYAPSGYLKANGAAISRSIYANLFAAIGMTFGSGDGSTTFNLPDLRGEFIRGWDDGRGVDPGRTLDSSQADETRSHTHTTAGRYMTIDGGTEYGNYGGQGGYPYRNDVNAAGGTETRPRNIALLACIRY